MVLEVREFKVQNNIPKNVLSEEFTCVLLFRCFLFVFFLNREHYFIILSGFEGVNFGFSKLILLLFCR
jgi:hypothetical protein